jgi:hypothetical protein
MVRGAEKERKGRVNALVAELQVQVSGPEVVTRVEKLAHLLFDTIHKVLEVPQGACGMGSCARTTDVHVFWRPIGSGAGFPFPNFSYKCALVDHTSVWNGNLQRETTVHLYTTPITGTYACAYARSNMFMHVPNQGLLCH